MFSNHSQVEGWGSVSPRRIHLTLLGSNCSSQLKRHCSLNAGSSSKAGCVGLALIKWLLSRGLTGGNQTCKGQISKIVCCRKCQQPSFSESYYSCRQSHHFVNVCLVFHSVPERPRVSWELYFLIHYLASSHYNT